MKTIDIQKFVNSYLATASWVTCDSGENTDFTKEAKKTATEECEDFIKLVIAEFGEVAANELLTVAGSDLDYLAAHDFYLTRNGHGAGFWDKPEHYNGQTTADKLSEISRKMGSADCQHINGPKSKLCFY